MFIFNGHMNTALWDFEPHTHQFYVLAYNTFA